MMSGTADTKKVTPGGAALGAAAAGVKQKTVGFAKSHKEDDWA